jgi:hypothetical protein
MRRSVVTLAGLLCLASASGCCCWDWCCNPCGSPCATPCGTPYGAPYGGVYSAPAGAYYAPGTAPVLSALPAGYPGAPVATAAIVPVESLPTY